MMRLCTAYARFFNDFSKMDYKPQVMRDPSLGGDDN
jgi:hypothetical protein